MVTSREQRFDDSIFPYDADKTQPGQLSIQLHTATQSSMWADDLVALARTWLWSLPGDDYRKGAITALQVALFALDDRAVERHAPDKDRLPTREEWIKMYSGLSSSEGKTPTTTHAGAEASC